MFESRNSINFREKVLNWCFRVPNILPKIYFIIITNEPLNCFLITSPLMLESSAAIEIITSDRLVGRDFNDKAPDGIEFFSVSLRYQHISVPCPVRVTSPDLLS